MADAGKFRFRIRPGCKVIKRNVDGREYRAKHGWYSTDDEGLCERLRSQKVHPNSPGSPCCFEVFTAKEARRRHEAEQIKREPMGTPDRPRSAPKRPRRRRATAAAAE